MRTSEDSGTSMVSSELSDSEDDRDVGGAELGVSMENNEVGSSGLRGVLAPDPGAEA